MLIIWPFELSELCSPDISRLIGTHTDIIDLKTRNLELLGVHLPQFENCNNGCDFSFLYANTMKKNSQGIRV